MIQQAAAQPHAKALVLAGLGILESGLLAWGSSGSSAMQLTVTCLVAALGSGLLLWLALDPDLDFIGAEAVVLTALLVRLVAMLGMPILEDDHYRYLWDGMRTATTLQPYALPPAAFFGDASWESDWQAILSGINNPDLPSIYGPTLQYLFAAGYMLSPGSLTGIQVLLVMVDLGVLALLMCSKVSARYLLAYAIHPLILSQAIVSAHPDILLGFFVVASLQAWCSRQAYMAGALFGLAVGTKVSAVLLLPFLCWPAGVLGCDQARATRRHLIQLAVGATLSLAALYLPFMLRQGNESTALQTFASQWQFNPLAFRLLLGVGLDGGTARWFAAAGVAFMVMGLVWSWRRSIRQASRMAWPPIDLALAALLVMSPVVNPWYWLWCMGPSLLRQTPWCLAFGAMAFVSYLNSTVLFEAGWSNDAGTGFAVPWQITALELVWLFTTVAFAWHRRATNYRMEST